MTYLAPDVGTEVLEHSLEVNDVFALIEQVTGRRLGAANLAVEAVAADSHSAAILQVLDGAPVLLLERLTHLDDGRPVDLEYIRMRGDRITLRGNLKTGGMMAQVNQRVDVPVTIDESLCIEGCANRSARRR
jgi:GntR family transcriptional regulator